MAGAIRWEEGSLDAAFDKARVEGKPLFLYWGASWCPPCNRQKAVLFPKMSTEGVVCYYLDGDAPGAQALAERFKLRSYPTNVVYRTDGTELTRLPCEVDATRFAALFALATAPLGIPVRASLDAALSTSRELSEDEWTLLAWYSWDTDEGVVLDGRDPAAVFATLEQACPVAVVRNRFAWFRAQAGGPMISVIETLRDPAAVADQLDLVLNWTVDLVRKTEPGSVERTDLVDAWLAALERIESDIAIPIVDRLQSLRNRVRLARFGADIPGLHAIARSRVDTARLSVSDPVMRHAMINTAAGVLSDAGLLDEAEQVLKEELPRSHSPFYFMHNLAAIAKKRGDSEAVIDWYRQAFESSTGSATRIQWCVTYIAGMLSNGHTNDGEVAKARNALDALLSTTPDAQSQRNETQLAKLRNL
jgi:hypothetical protein